MADRLARARSPARRTRIGARRCLASMPRRAMSMEPSTNSAPLPLNQLMRTCESGRKQSRMASQSPVSRLSRSRSMSWVTALMSAPSSTAGGKALFMMVSPGCLVSIALPESYPRDRAG